MVICLGPTILLTSGRLEVDTSDTSDTSDSRDCWIYGISSIRREEEALTRRREGGPFWFKVFSSKPAVD